MSAELISYPKPLRMTEEEFDAWCDEDTRAEFVDGEVVNMSPVSLAHADLGGFLAALLRFYVEERSPGGRVLGPEFQIRLRSGLRRVPDLLYVTPEHQDHIKKTRLEGAPDAAWEIISPDSVERDWRDKYLEYQHAGVREYWVIDPYTQRCVLYRLRDDGRFETVAEEQGRLASQVIPGFWLRPDWLWAEPLPLLATCLRELDVLP
jgi:Uma2 family endonuclease